MWLDFVILIPILFGLVRGLIRGAVIEIASFLAILIALWVSKIYASPLAVHFQNWFDLQEKSATIIAFITVFFVSLILVQLLARLLDKFLSAVSLGWLNKLCGALFGAMKFILIMSVVLNAFAFINDKITLVEKETTDNSLLYNPIKSIVISAIPHLTENNFNDETTRDNN